MQKKLKIPKIYFCFASSCNLTIWVLHLVQQGTKSGRDLCSSSDLPGGDAKMWLEVSDAREGAGFVGESLPPDAGPTWRRREEEGRAWSISDGQHARRRARPDPQGSSAEAGGSPWGRGGQASAPLPRPHTGHCLARARPPLRCHSRCRSAVKPEAASWLRPPWQIHSQRETRAVCLEGCPMFPNWGGDSPCGVESQVPEAMKAVCNWKEDRQDRPSPSTNPHVWSLVHAKGRESWQGWTFRSLQQRWTTVRMEKMYLALLNICILKIRSIGSRHKCKSKTLKTIEDCTWECICDFRVEKYYTHTKGNNHNGKNWQH